MYTKYPRTRHLPWSPGKTPDDLTQQDSSIFTSNDVVITEKMDGENTTLYSNGQIHARSIDGKSNPWQDVIKKMWAERFYALPAGYRVVGENLVAKHSIEYDGLPPFMVFGVFCGDTLLSWDETIDFAFLLDLSIVPVLYRGCCLTEKQLRAFHRQLDTTKQEGFVIRLADKIPQFEFGKKVAKWVRNGHVVTDEHWTKNWSRNNYKI